MVDVLPVVDEGLGNSAYIVDLGDGSVLVVDPERDPRPYRNQTLRFVVETHLHADFVSGGRELAAAAARLVAPAGSDLTYDHEQLRDGDELDLGGLTLQAIATPGHTPEHLAYLLLDGCRPVALFSGGTLMAGGVARTDLLSPEMTEPLARKAYRSVRERLFALPDDLPVYPTHGGGSFCASVSGGERTTTIGREKATNPLFADDPDEQTFVSRLLGGYGSFPPYFLELRDVNRAGPDVYGESPPGLAPLSPEQVQGAEVVDVRGLRAFAEGHLPGSLSIPWRPQFATWLGWLVARDQPVAFVTDGTVRPQDLAWACLTVGYERLVGVLAGGIESWVESGREIATIPLVDPDAVGQRRLVDVRQRSEYEAGHVSGALHVELGSIVESHTVEGPAVVHCGHGERAMSAASLLVRAGGADVAVLVGGPQELGAAGYDIEAGS